MKNKNTFWMVACVGLVALAVVVAFLAFPNGTVAARTKNVVGAWDVSITVVGQNATFPGFLSFFNDGNLIADELPSPLETSAHGSWVSTGQNQAVYTASFLIGSTTPNEWIKGTINGSLRYDPHADSWNGPFTINIVDQSGNPVLSDTGTMDATRITATR
jgi:hypothetical protein